jgi:hypothetical protein
LLILRSAEYSLDGVGQVQFANRAGDGSVTLEKLYKNVSSPESSHESIDADVEWAVDGDGAWHRIAKSNQAVTGNWVRIGGSALDVTGDNDRGLSRHIGKWRWRLSGFESSARCWQGAFKKGEREKRNEVEQHIVIVELG